MKTLAVLLALLGTPAAAQLYEAPNNTICLLYTSDAADE